MTRLILLLLLIPSVCFGANYYVDPTYSGSNGNSNGSYLRPWTSIEQVNKHSFNPGDGLYFRAGTLLKMTAPLRVTWSGSVNNRVVIGAYHGENQFGLGGKSRPVLDGQEWTVPTREGWSGMITSFNHRGYVTIQDLEIRKSGAVGISLGNSHNIYDFPNTHYIVRNCFIDRPWRQGILVARASNNLIEDNRTFYTSYGHRKPNRIGGASIEITAMHREKDTQYNLVRNNTVEQGSFEGIGLYKQARYNTVENNIVFDCGTYNIYVSRSRDNVVRNNLVYATNNARRMPNSRGVGIVISSETHDYKWGVPWGGNQIHNNKVAGLNSGIVVSTHWEAMGYGPENTIIYNNRLVDNITNFRFYRPDEYWKGIKVYENYSFIFIDDGSHCSQASPMGTSWNRNYFTSPPTVSGNTANNAIINQVILKKTFDWRNLQPGVVKKTFFDFIGENSPTPIGENETAERPQKVLNFSIQ